MRWRERLIDGRWALLAAALVLAMFAILGSLPAWQAAGGFAVVLAAMVLVPRRPGATDKDNAGHDAEIEAWREAMIGFADALPDPCFLLDRRDIVLHRNALAASAFPGASVGKPMAFLVRNPALIAAIGRVRDGGHAETVELHQTVPNETWFEAHVAPLGPRGTGGGALPDRILVTLHNLTEQKRVEAMRVDFIANASHELRTPLTSVIGFIETLQGPAARDAEARERFLGIMRQQAGRMSNLIDDLLSLSRIELRQHVRPKGEVELTRLLPEVIEGLQTQAGEAGVEISFSAPDEPVKVTGERDELYEVFENLIDNAVKYGSDGKVVDVRLAHSDRPGFAEAVTIADHGPGIPAEHVPRLTERFYRVDAESSRKKKGTGLGLAIVKHILNRHNGQMNIRSVVGEGTTVEILLAR